jgi:regulator of replication initiation timing
LYSSHLCSWRGQRRKGILNALGRKRGAKAKSSTQLENEKLRRENERLRKKLAHAEKIIDVQKKLSEVLGIPLDGETDATDSD